MKESRTIAIGIFFAIFSLTCPSSLVAQFLIADYPLTTNSLDQSGHFGPITYGINGTPPPTAACATGNNRGTFITPDLHSLFNRSNFQVDLDFKSNGIGAANSEMPVFMIGPIIPDFRTIGVVISPTGKIGVALVYAGSPENVSSNVD